MESNTLIQERQQLRELLAQYSDESKQLPYLKAEIKSGWGQKFWEAFLEWGAEWWEWLREIFGPMPSLGSSQIDWKLLLQIVFWGCVALLVGWLVWRLVKKGLTLSLTPYERAHLPNQLLTEEERLSNRLLAAVEDENWSLAARLRWRLFLYRIDAQSHLTPNELFGQSHYRHLWEQHRGVPLREQYRVMFTGTNGSSQWYDQYHGGLASLEGPPRPSLEGAP